MLHLSAPTSDAGRHDDRPSASAPRRGARLRPLVRSVATASVAALVAVLGVVGSGSTAAADTVPPAGVPATASARPLPTWQINGVAWSQVVVGTTVYVTGSFPTARPPGVAVGGAGEVLVGNIMAYDIRTGNRISSFKHELNGQGRFITASPDGRRVYVGGDFTAVDGQPRGHIAAFDTATGDLVPGFRPSTNGRVRSITATNSTVYFGGTFSSVSGASRGNLAAASASTGAVTSWAPRADNHVWSMVLTPDQGRLVVGGQFERLNSQLVYGHGAVDASTGANTTWLANARIRDSVNGAINSLSTDGTLIYGTGWAYGGGGGRFEGVFAANPADGSIRWVADCLGDTYGAAGIGGVVYTVGHAHDCSVMQGGFPDTQPRVRWQRSLAFTTRPTHTIPRPDAYGWDFSGLPAPGLLHWYPQWAAGTVTGQYQSAWAVSGNSDYVVAAGEFPVVNNRAQQGLARFGIGDRADHGSGPTYSTKPERGTPATTATVLAPGQVRVTFGSAWDTDNEELSYQLVRNGDTPVGEPILGTSNFWTLPNRAIVDDDAPAGTHTYTVRISDPHGRVLTSPVSNSVRVIGSLGTYGNAVLRDDPAHYWRLGETSGSTAADVGRRTVDLSTRSGLTWGTGGIIRDDTAATVDGTSAGGAAMSRSESSPTSFSVEAWFKTTTTRGGKIVGFGNSSTGTSSSYDRHVYMNDQGRLTFGVYDGTARTLTSERAYNDGVWHQVVATLDGSGFKMYVDGMLAGQSTATTRAQDYTGFWSIGGDNLGGWPQTPSSWRFAGSIDEVAVYDAALSLNAVQAHYTASGRTVGAPPPPSDDYGTAVLGSDPELFWRLDESSGTTAVDYTRAADGRYTGGYTLREPGAIDVGTGVRFDGVNANVATTQLRAGPSTYTQELWFNTTTTRGGKLIGFGNATTGNSSSYDRHVYMRDNGTLSFGTYTGRENVITSRQSFNDGRWHHLAATQGPSGMALYVDGALVGTNAATGAQSFSGYWRIGGDVTWGGASSNWFAGRLDEVAIYDRALSKAEIQEHVTAGGGTIGNQLPVATFASGLLGGTLSVDGSLSRDADGTIESYAWDFGDGAKATGVKATHVYERAGTYQVTLTVTDDRGGVATSTRTLTVSNTSPDAAFTATSNGLGVAVDGSGSTDADGTIQSYAWDFGDGTTRTGRTASHTYAAAGTYTVTLKVTDDRGATDTASREVTVSVSGVIAQDDFDRTVTGGLGSADVGGAWSLTGGNALFSVSDGAGAMRMSAAGRGAAAWLPGVSSTDTDLRVDIGLDRAATGGGIYTYVTARGDLSSGYRTKMRATSDGRLQAWITAVAGGSEATLTGTTVPGLEIGAGSELSVRVQAWGQSPTRLRAKIWKAGTPEPSDWLLSATDSTSSLQAAGGVALRSYLSGSATNAPVVMSFDDLRARPTGN